MRPTELCLALAYQGRMIAEAAREAEAAVDLYNGGKSGTARLAGTPIFMDGVISTMIASFQSAFPEVTIHQSYGYLAELAEQLNVGNIDLAICPVRRDKIPPNMIFKPILEGRNVIACASSHPLSRKSSLKLSEIADYPWIAPPADSPLYEDLQEALRSIGIKDVKVSFTGGSLASIISVLTGSEALTVLPYSVVFLQQHLKTLSSLPIKIDHPARELGLLWRGDREPRPAVDRFRKYIEAEFVGLGQNIIQRGRDSIWRT